MIDLGNISLHDVTVTGIEVRSTNDHFDYVSLSLEASEFKKEFGTNTVRLIFEDCYKAEFRLQMWISGKDSIRSHSIKDDSPWIKELQELEDKGVSLPKGSFKHFVLELNSSGSTIEVLARNVKMEGN